MIGEVIADIRKLRKLTQYQLANKIQVSYSRLALIEQGKQDAFFLLNKIAKALDILPEYILILSSNRTDHFAIYVKGKVKRILRV